MQLNVQHYTEDEMEQIFHIDVWGPNYWYFLMTLALSYPDHINPVIKRKYYDFICNLPVFIPNQRIGNKFCEILDKYPVSPYLDCRDSFVRWVVFVHNKINEQLGKPVITREEAIRRYFKQMVPTQLQKYEEKEWKKYVIYSGVIAGLVGLACWIHMSRV